VDQVVVHMALAAAAVVTQMALLAQEAAEVDMAGLAETAL
jgi:hypothetical protein